ncbi:hypothetical protein HYX14_02030 [Candidatus Woesearchaeota archaeon]|nr:hypothetical protein [Candidatus Woesearchaeota archaeon]
MKELYKAKGYSDDWIEKRVRGIAIRDELTDEWDNRGVKTEKEDAQRYPQVEVLPKEAEEWQVTLEKKLKKS